MMKKILFFALAGLMMSGCAKFLEEESHSEVIPKTTEDFAELLRGEAYPRGAGASDHTPDFSLTQFMDDDVAFVLDLQQWVSNPLGGGSSVLMPNYYVGADITEGRTPFKLYTWQPDEFEYDGLNKKINAEASGTAYAGFYNKIMGCNVVLNYIDDAVGPQPERDLIKAQALGLRALYYFWLVNYYGEPYNLNKEAQGVPMVVDSDINEEEITPSTVAEVYEDIIVPDLVEAIRLQAELREAGELPALPDNRELNERAMKILLSRVYLYMERYDDCIDQVDEAIVLGARLLDMTGRTNPGDTLLLNPNGGVAYYATIARQNVEVEWIYGTSSTRQNQAFSTGRAPEFQAIWTDKVNDKRFSVYKLAIPAQAQPGAALNSLLIAPGKPNSTNGYGMAIRTAEAYLNRAEAYALKGVDGPAMSDLNTLRRNRIKNYSDENLAGEALMDAIKTERRKELCFEGHRWFDLRRWLKYEDASFEIRHIYRETPNVDVVYTLPKGDPAWTLPFPQSVLESNRRIVQNASGKLGAPARPGVTL